jgi:glucose/mannose-6-phosphate isomerase
VIEPVIDLDDVGAVEGADPDEMLRAVASSAAQAREAVVRAAEAGIGKVEEYGRPRAIVVVGMGGSGVAGEVLAAAVGPSCPVPVVGHRGYGLPGWVGAHDLVLAVSCSGVTAETLSATEEAARRGVPLAGVGAARSPLEELVARGRGPYVHVPGGRQPRASLWSLVVPLLMVADHLDLLGEPLGVEAAAERLEAVAELCHPARDLLVNPAKELALALSGTLPSVWGTSPLTGAVAYRFACQLNENAKSPATWGVLPEAAHNQVVAYDGAFGPGPVDIFADPDLDGPPATGLHQVLLRDPDREHPDTARRADVCAELAADRGVGVSQLNAEGLTRIERLASLIGLTDYASVYLALATGSDPTPVDAITTLKARLSR